jgi:hypothetical protein
MFALQTDLVSAVLKTCQHDSSIILRWLRAEGFIDIETPVFPNCDDKRCYSEPEDFLPVAQSMKVHLKLLWLIVEQRKVSIAITYNPLMTAVGYIYQDHDIGWRQSQTLPFFWRFKETSPAAAEKDEAKSKEIFFKYSRPLNYGLDLARITTTFIDAMSIYLGPTLAWVPAFQISVPLGKTPTPTVYMPETACAHCSAESREESYRKDIRNMYRDPPLHGYPHGTIPKATLALYAPDFPTTPPE